METQQTMQQRVEQCINRLYSDPSNPTMMQDFVDKCMQYREAYPQASVRFWKQVIPGWRRRRDLPREMVDQFEFLFITSCENACTNPCTPRF